MTRLIKSSLAFLNEKLHPIKPLIEYTRISGYKDIGNLDNISACPLLFKFWHFF